MSELLHAKMKRIIKKIIVRLLITLLVLLVLLAIGVALALNYIFTPEKITPKIQEMAKEYVDGDIKFGAIDLTFFSTFPRLGIRIKDTYIVSNTFSNGIDSLSSRRDTIAQFDELRLGVNIKEYIDTKHVKIDRIRLINPDIRLITDSLGNANWNLLKNDTTAADTASAFELKGIDLKYIRVDNAKVRYGDRVNRIFAGADSLDLLLEGEISPTKFDISINISDKGTSFSKDRMRYFRRLPLGFKTKVHFDGPTHRFIFDETSASINGVNINVDGWATKADSVSYDLDVNFNVESPSVEAIFGLIPESFIDKEIDVKSGDISASGSIVGLLNDKNIPVLTFNASIGDVQAKYEGMPYGIEDLTAEFNAMIDTKKPKKCYANIDIFHFKGGKSEIKATAKVKELLADPFVDCDIESHLDLNSAMQLFPITNITMSGIADANIKASFRMSDLERQNIGRMKINGTIQTDSIKIVSDEMKFRLNSDMRLRFASTDTMSVLGSMNRLNFNYGDIRIRGQKMRVMTKAVTQPDTTAISPLTIRVRASRLMYRSDSLSFLLKNFRSLNYLKPTVENKRMPHFDVNVKADTILSRIYGTRGYTKDLVTEVHVNKVDTIWYTDAKAAFKEVRANTPAYLLPLKATNGSIAKEGKLIKIDHLGLEAGQTNAEINGEIYNIIGALLAKKPLEAKFNLTADTLNFNQLLSAIPEEVDYKANDNASFASDTTIVVSTNIDADVSTDSLRAQLIEIPRGIKFELTAKVGTVIWDKIVVNDIRGKTTLANSAIHLNAIKLKQNGSDITATLAYRGYKRRKTGEANFCFLWDRADVGYIINALGLDTVMPMLEPLRGTVTCALATNVKLDSMMQYDLHKIKAGIHLSASKLTLLDNKTFSKISKVLMFKNKKENVIDTLSLNILADSGQIEILPFVANIDRYRAVVGGTQDIDMTKLNYHVSIVKSPLPFKAGVNITGNPDDIDIDITRAKLKNHADKEVQDAYDKQTYNQRVKIVADCYRLSRLEMPAALQKVLGDEEYQKIINRARMRTRAIERDTTELKQSEILDSTAVVTETKEKTAPVLLHDAAEATDNTPAPTDTIVAPSAADSTAIQINTTPAAPDSTNTTTKPINNESATENDTTTTAPPPAAN